MATNHQNKVIFNHRRELHVFCILDYIFKEVIFPSERLETEYVDFSTKWKKKDPHTKSGCLLVEIGKSFQAVRILRMLTAS